jgi:hypothetical protein
LLGRRSKLVLFDAAIFIRAWLDRPCLTPLNGCDRPTGVRNAYWDSLQCSKHMQTFFLRVPAASMFQLPSFEHSKHRSRRVKLKSIEARAACVLPRIDWKVNIGVDILQC